MLPQLSSDKSATVVMDVLSEAKSKPLSSLSVFSFIPARRTEHKEMRYFNCSPRVRSSAHFGILSFFKATTPMSLLKYPFTNWTVPE